LTEPTLAKQMGMFSCGQVGADRRAAITLAVLDDAALPGIEAELDAMERHGHEGFGSEWVELAYARIKGHAAYPRLRRLENDPRFGDDREFPDDSGRWSLDRSIALALGLTSFVSAPKNAMVSYDAEPPLNILCHRSTEPRDALDQFIRAFERNDEFSFEVGLGRDAKSALTLLLKGTTWKEYRRELLHGDTPGDLAVGYRFEDSGRWSEPEETLEDERPAAPVVESPVLKTEFTNASGTDCGHFQVSFDLSHTEQKIRRHTPYMVNNSDLDGLLHLIASCVVAR